MVELAARLDYYGASFDDLRLLSGTDREYQLFQLARLERLAALHRQAAEQAKG